MNGKSWKTDNWFISPWNFTEEVRRELKFPGTIRVHDITLRDGEQQAGVVSVDVKPIRMWFFN